MSKKLTEVHIRVFNKTLELKEFNRITGKDISQWSGFHVSKVSRFRTGKVDLESGDFLYLISCMPVEFQERFWTELLTEFFPVTPGSDPVRMLHIKSMVDSLKEEEYGFFFEMMSEKFRMDSKIEKKIEKKKVKI